MLVRNDTKNALNGEKVQTETVPTPALPGYRAPDIKLYLPALLEPVWLQEVTPNNARFYIVAFTGDVEKTRSGYRDFADSVKASGLLSSSRPEMNGKLIKGQTTADRIGQIPVGFVTIIAGTEANVWHAVGTEPFGKAFYDQDGSAHDRYAVNVEEGMLMILRPDGWIGARLGLGSSGLVGDIEAYFQLFLRL